MCLSCNFVNVYTIAYRVQFTRTRAHARILNGHPRDDRRAEAGEDVRVGVRVGAVECQLHGTGSVKIWKTRRKISADVRIFFLRCAARVTHVQWTVKNAIETTYD